jgi:hypothetical protein
MASGPKLSRVHAPTLFAGSQQAGADDTLIMPSLRRAERKNDGAPDTLVMAPGELSFDTIAPLRRGSRPALVRVELGAQPEVVPAPPVDAPPDAADPATDLTAPPAVSQRVGGAFVKAYRVAGFVILAAILGGLGTYVGTHLFFLFNRSWVAPSILTPAEPRVLGFASRFVEESARKDALLVQRADVETRRREAERALAIETAFQSAYNAAMREDLADRKADLARAKSMLGAYATARRSIASAGDAFRSSSEQRLRQEFEAGVIDKDHVLSGNMQLAQLADARLSLDARNVEIQGRVAALSRIVDSLDSAVRAGGSATSYEILKIRADFDRSVAAAAKASDELEATSKSVAMIDETIQAEERIIETMKRSAYHGITSGRAVFAFVPYDNAGSAKEGAPVYACRFGIMWCRKVGRLGKGAEGEVVQKHPLLHQDLRGLFVRMEIDDPVAAENAVLHVARRPLFL